jgi:predicted dehydrogenase
LEEISGKKGFIMETRRQFLRTSAAAAVVSQTVRGANDRIQMGVIGTGTRGMQDFRSFSYHEDSVFVAACDVNKVRLEAAVQTMGGKVDSYGDYRRILDRKDIDAVLVTTPDHWHSPITVEACAAGKDVYVEKPISNTLPAAQKMVEAAQKYKRVVQMGCQQRSTPHFQACVKMIQDGLLGKVTHAVLLYPGGYARIQQPPEPPPPTLDWEMFQGPAPRKPYSPSRMSWRSFYAYGGGLITDWGVHLTDIAHMALGCDRKGPALTGVSAQWVTMPRDDEQIPEAFICTWQYEDFVMSFTNAVPPGQGFDMSGNWFYGRRGALHVNRAGYHILPAAQRAAPPPQAARGGAAGAPAGGGAAGGAQPGRGRGGGGGQPAGPPIEAKDFRNTDRGIGGDGPLHARNFLDCIKSRQKPNCDIEIGFYSSLPCLLAVMAIQAGRSIAWDGKTAKPA